MGVLTPQLSILHPESSTLNPEALASLEKARLLGLPTFLRVGVRAGFPEEGVGPIGSEHTSEQDSSSEATSRHTAPF